VQEDRRITLTEEGAQLILPIYITVMPYVSELFRLLVILMCFFRNAWPALAVKERPEFVQNGGNY
jgi:hypothetical protein